MKNFPLKFKLSLKGKLLVLFNILLTTGLPYFFLQIKGYLTIHIVFPILSLLLVLLVDNTKYRKELRGRLTYLYKPTKLFVIPLFAFLYLIFFFICPSLMIGGLFKLLESTSILQINLLTKVFLILSIGPMIMTFYAEGVYTFLTSFFNNMIGNRKAQKIVKVWLHLFYNQHSIIIIYTFAYILFMLSKYYSFFQGYPFLENEYIRELVEESLVIYLAFISVINKNKRVQFNFSFLWLEYYNYITEK